MDSVAVPAINDMCSCAGAPDIVAQLDQSKNEKVVFSCTLFKKNRFGMKQERTLLLTNIKLYNVKKHEMQRAIAIENIKALTKSMDPKRATSFIVHVASEYDYVFDSEQRDDVFKQIKYYFWNAKKRNLPIYAVKDSIDEFATKKTDIQKDREVQPLENARNRAEDIYPEEGTGAEQ